MLLLRPLYNVAPESTSGLAVVGMDVFSLVVVKVDGGTTVEADGDDRGQ